MTHVLYIGLSLYGGFTALMMLGIFLDLSGTRLSGRLLRTLMMGVIWPYFVGDNVWHWYETRKYRKIRMDEALKYNPLSEDECIYIPTRKSPHVDPKTGKINLKWDPLYCPHDINLPTRKDTSPEGLLERAEWMVEFFERCAKDADNCGDRGCVCLEGAKEDLENQLREYGASKVPIVL
jgi:hypothetical protein